MRFPWDFRIKPVHVALVLFVVAAGCFVIPPQGLRYICSVQVSPLADPDLVIELSNFDDERFLDDDGELLWDYFQCLFVDECPFCGFEEPEELIPLQSDVMVDHFSRLVQTRIGQLAQDPDSEFAQFDEWCEVPGTRVCAPPEESRRDGEEFDYLTQLPQCTDFQVGETPLPICPTPPPPDACLEIECGEDEGCGVLDFGGVPVGQLATRNVSLTNCGEPGDPTVPISVLRFVRGFDTPASAITLLDAEPSCLPDAPEGERVLTLASEDPTTSSCSFTVQVEPANAGLSNGQVLFRGAIPQHEIAVSALGVAGTPAASPPLVCIQEDPGGGCYGLTTVRITNVGDGDLQITELRIPELNGEPQNFQLVPESGPELPTILSNDGAGLDVDLQWCEGEPADNQARLEVVTSSPTTPTLLVPLQVRPDCNAP